MALIASGGLGKLVRWQRLLQRNGGGRVSPLRQLSEIGYLWARNGIRPPVYYRMGLFRASLSWSEKKEFLGTGRYWRKVHRINPERYRIVTWNKLVAHGSLQSFDIPTTKFYGFISPYSGQTYDGLRLRRFEDLDSLLRRIDTDRIAFKLVGGWQGRGFFRVRLDLGSDPIRNFVEPDGPWMTLGDLWRNHLCFDENDVRSKRHLSYGYLCESVIDQHPVLEELHAESLNTARVWMYQAEPGRWEMFAAILRMGTSRATVDNGLAGGIAARIDPHTGRLDPAIRRYPQWEELDHHPTTDTRITGIELPMWDQVLPLCRRTCSVFPYLGLLALDIAFAPNGLVVTEVEADPPCIHQANFGRGVRSLLTTLDRKRRKAPLR